MNGTYLEEGGEALEPEGEFLSREVRESGGAPRAMEEEGLYEERFDFGKKYLNPSVPDSIICVGSRWRQISTFRLLTRDGSRLRARKMS